MQKPPRIPKDLEPLTAKAREALKGRRAVIFAYLFGSRARNASTPLSDVDVAVYLSDVSPMAEEKLGILGDLIASLEANEIDLVVLNTAPLPLKARVLRNSVILLDREPHFRHAFESLVLRQYFDFAVKESAILERRFSFG